MLRQKKNYYPEKLAANNINYPTAITADVFQHINKTN